MVKIPTTAPNKGTQSPRYKLLNKLIGYLEQKIAIFLWTQPQLIRGNNEKWTNEKLR